MAVEICAQKVLGDMLALCEGGVVSLRILDDSRLLNRQGVCARVQAEADKNPFASFGSFDDQWDDDALAARFDKILTTSLSAPLSPRSTPSEPAAHTAVQQNKASSKNHQAALSDLRLRLLDELVGARKAYMQADHALAKARAQGVELTYGAAQTLRKLLGTEDYAAPIGQAVVALDMALTVTARRQRAHAPAPKPAEVVASRPELPPKLSAYPEVGAGVSVPTNQRAALLPKTILWGRTSTDLLSAPLRLNQGDAALLSQALFKKLRQAPFQEQGRYQVGLEVLQPPRKNFAALLQSTHKRLRHAQERLRQHEARLKEVERRISYSP